MAETKESRALRILAEGRLTISRVDMDGKVLAECRGLESGEIHQLGWDPRGRGRWGCTCQANATFRRRCSHLIALQLVVARQVGRG